MNYNFYRIVVLSALCAALTAFSVNAQGVIVTMVCETRPCCPPAVSPRPLTNRLAVESIKLNVKIEGQIATTRVVQVFRNDSRQTLEGTYFFPIPDTAAIVEFAIWENGRKIVSEVRSRVEARRIYDEIVRRQRDPGLLEYAGRNLLQASIYPILPLSEKKIELTYTEILKSESGTVAYRYPLGTGSKYREISPRTAVIDQSNYTGTLEKQKIGNVSGSVEIAGSEPIRNVYSPSHQFNIDAKSEKSVKLSFETVDNDNDLRLFYSLSKAEVGLTLLTYREAGKDGYFLLQLLPNSDVREDLVTGKDIVFVLDTSGSMADKGKMEKARAALLFGVQSLRAADRFNIISFAGEEHLMESNLIRADADGKKRGEHFVKELKPNGGTNINDALIAAHHQLNASGNLKYLVFITDGLPTVGESNIEKILKNVAGVKIPNLRLFSFGVGYDVNTRLLDKLAAENAGTAEYIEPDEDLEIKVSNFFGKVNYPVLTSLNLNFGQIVTDFLYPRALNDLFRGSQITLIGRYTNSADMQNAKLVLSGKSGGEIRIFEYKNTNFPLRADKNDFLPRLWATRRVGWLIEEIRSNGESKELRDEIIELGTLYGIVTPYTSQLAAGSLADNGALTSIDSKKDYRRNTNSSGNLQAREPAALKATTGRTAVRISKQAQAQQDAETIYTLDENLNGRLKQIERIGAKTFYFENAFWVDSQFNAKAGKREVILRFASAEFFELIGKEKELAQFFALGKNVVVVWNDKIYRITE